MNACRPLTCKLRAMQKWRLASYLDLFAQEEIAEFVGSDQWSLPERFALYQGGETKFESLTTAETAERMAPSPLCRTLFIMTLAL